MENDLISRSALLKKAQALLSFDGKEVVWVRDDVLLAPTIDPLKALGVCRCGECTSFIAGDADCDIDGYCRNPLACRYVMARSKDSFCSYAEKREEAQQ